MPVETTVCGLVRYFYIITQICLSLHIDIYPYRVRLAFDQYAFKSTELFVFTSSS